MKPMLSTNDLKRHAQDAGFTEQIRPLPFAILQFLSKREVHVMTSTIGRLESIPIRDVWQDEARDLTPWLADNLDALSKALGIDLEFQGTEISVGPFSADLVLRNANTGEPVIVENMMAHSDHDHLGKLITYAAGLDATYAVLVAKSFRREHRSALQWLNANSTDSVHFFGVELKAWRIGDSLPAPQLDIVVEPDEWKRAIRAETGTLSETQRTYRDFWTEFLPQFHRSHPDWSQRNTPAKGNWMDFPAGLTGLHYSANFCRSGVRWRFRVELYVNANDKETATARFDALKQERDVIEAQIGEPLEWDPLLQNKGCRIASYYCEDVRVEDRDRWADIRTWAIGRMGALRDAFRPHIDKLS